MTLFIESTSIDMWEIIEDDDDVPIIEQPMPHMVVDPVQVPQVMVRLIPKN